MKSYYLSIVTQYDDEKFFFTDDLEALDEFRDVIKNGYDNGNGKPQPVIEAQIEMTETSGGMIVTEEVIASYRKYTTYAPDTDITFILVDYKEYHESSTEVIGFYYGGENADLTESFSGNTKATFRDVEYFFKEDIMANRIPRNVTEMDVEFLSTTSAGKPGTKMKARKDEHGWHGTDENGQSWFLFPSHLRCSELCRLSNMK